MVLGRGDIPHNQHKETIMVNEQSMQSSTFQPMTMQSVETTETGGTPTEPTAMTAAYDGAANVNQSEMGCEFRLRQTC